MTRLLLGLALLAFVVYTAATALTQVQPGERAVVRRFGRLLPEKPGPGLYRGLPWGMERVDRVPVQGVRRVSVGFTEQGDEDAGVLPPGQMLTGDHNLVNVQAEIQYAVRDADVEKFVLQADDVDALVARAAESVLAEWVAARAVDDVLLQGKVLLPATLREQVRERLRPYDVGVEVEQASVTQLFPPNEVKEAFDRLAKAQTDIRTRVYDAEQKADRKRRDAEAESYQLRRSAGAYAREQDLQARAEADSFNQRLGQYRQLSRENPGYLNTLWLDEMTRLYSRMQEAGRIDLLDHHLSGEGINITQFPLQKKKS